jgi:hypothetical protein
MGYSWRKGPAGLVERSELAISGDVTSEIRTFSNATKRHEACQFLGGAIRVSTATE